MTPAEQKKLSAFFDALFEKGEWVAMSSLPEKEFKDTVKGIEASNGRNKARDLFTDKNWVRGILSTHRIPCFGVNPVKPTTTRLYPNLSLLKNICVDVDNASLPDFARHAQFVFSRTPKHHHIYFLFEPIPASQKNFARYSELVKKFLFLSNSEEKQAHDATRAMRIPYTTHTKKGKKGPGYILAFHNKRKRYTIDEMEKLAGIEGGDDYEVKETTKEKDVKNDNEQAAELTQSQRLNFLRRHYQTKGQVTAGDGRSRTLFFIGLDAHGWGIELDEALKLAYELNGKHCDPPEDSKTVEHQVRSAYKYRKAPFGDFADKAAGSATAAARNKELKRFEELQRVREELREHVYVTGSEMLIDRKRRLQYTTEKQINNYIAHSCGTRLTLSSLLTEQAIYVADKSDFRPDVKTDIFEENGIGFYNRFVPHVLPESSKDKKALKIFKEHLHFLTTSETEFKTLVNFFAFMVQKPGAKIHWSPFIISQSHGVGKSLLAELGRSLFSRRYVTSVEGHEFLLPQTDFMEDKILIIGEEIELGEKNVMTRLRSLITGEVYRNIAKYQRTIDMTNCANFMFFSNRIDAVKIDKFDRRLFVIFNKKKPRDAAYYQELYKVFTENAAEIYEYLLSVDLSAFNPTERPPMTHGKQVLIEQSTGELEMYLESEEENKSGAFEYECVSVTKILDDIKYGAPDSVKKWCGQKSVRFYLRGRGFNDFKGRLVEEGETVHRRLWFKGDSEAEFKKALARDEAKRVKEAEGVSK
jgi:hypothetical protein